MGQKTHLGGIGRACSVVNGKWIEASYEHGKSHVYSMLEFSRNAEEVTCKVCRTFIGDQARAEKVHSANVRRDAKKKRIVQTQEDAERADGLHLRERRIHALMDALDVYEANPSAETWAAVVHERGLIRRRLGPKPKGRPAFGGPAF